MQAKELGVVLPSQVLDRLPEVLDLVRVRDIVTLEELHILFKNPLVEVALRVSAHEKLVEVVRDTTTVLDVAYHVTDGRPRPRGSLLAVHFHDVVL